MGTVIGSRIDASPGARGRARPRDAAAMGDRDELVVQDDHGEAADGSRAVGVMITRRTCVRCMVAGVTLAVLASAAGLKPDDAGAATNRPPVAVREPALVALPPPFRASSICDRRAAGLEGHALTRAAVVGRQV